MIFTTKRIICNKPLLALTNILFKECKTLKLNETNIFCVLIYIHKKMNKVAVFESHSYLTRNKGKLRNKRASLSISQQNMSHIKLRI